MQPTLKPNLQIEFQKAPLVVWRLERHYVSTVHSTFTLVIGLISYSFQAD